jgi:diguanylate cyclase (GGDEF)-like protein
VSGHIISWSFIAPGALGTIHVYGEDVTERKRAEESVKEQARLNGYQALHDSLTGLGNRRKLMEDGERKLELASDEAPVALAIFDLDGFKRYNDTFGHPAGDALLARLSDRLREVLPGEATAYRMGGDEFCVLAEVPDVDQLVVVASDALAEAGDSFSITSSAGAAVMPDEAQTLVQALQLADQRLYANKRTRRTSAGEARDALIQVLAEQDPRLASHMSNVAGLAAATARRLGLAEDEVARIRLAAELHDVGKTAIPNTILDKPGPLDDDEWAFMQRHTLIGERILAAAPALAGVASLVRASHERMDGAGYPDQLAGDQIPLSARIVAIADAFDAMIAERPYREALSVTDALTELQRCSGTQFDGLVVAVFAEVVKERQRLSVAA